MFYLIVIKRHKICIFHIKRGIPFSPRFLGASAECLKFLSKLNPRTLVQAHTLVCLVNAYELSFVVKNYPVKTD